MSDPTPSDSEFLEKLYGENPVKPPAGTPGGPILGDELDGAPQQPPLKLGPNRPASGDPTVKMPRGKPGGETTRIRSTGETTRAPRADAPTRRIDPNRTVRIKNPPENIVREHGKQTFREQVPRAPARTIKPSSPEGLERVAQKIPREVAHEAQAAARQAGQHGMWSKIRPRLRGIVISMLAGMAIFAIAYGIFEYATNEALRKMGPDQDLTALLPQNNSVEWISAPFSRATRDESNPYWEPNVFEERVTLNSPRERALAFGISLDGLPEQEFTNDINVNDLGNGNSDWLCEPFGGYLVCRSLGGYPLEKSSAALVTMQFHVPGSELNEYLKTPSGSRKVYIIAPR